MTGESDGARLNEFLTEFTRIGALRAFNDDVEPGVHDAVQHACTPLDHHNGVSKVDIEIIEFDGTVQAIGIHVNQGWTFTQAGVGSGKNESGRGNGSTNLQAFTNTACECGLARA